MKKKTQWQGVLIAVVHLQVPYFKNLIDVTSSDPSTPGHPN